MNRSRAELQEASNLRIGLFGVAHLSLGLVNRRSA